MRDKDDTPRRLYRRKDLAAILQLDPVQVNSLVRTGQLRLIRIGAVVRCDSHDVDQLIETYLQLARRKTGMWSSATSRSELSELQLVLYEDASSSTKSTNRMPSLHLRMDEVRRIPPTNPTEAYGADVWASYPLWWALLCDEGLLFVAKLRPTNSRTRLRHPLPSCKGFDLPCATTLKEPIHARRSTHRHPDRSGWPRTVI
jgi:hypothetical protein